MLIFSVHTDNMMFKLQGMLWPYVPVLLKEIYNAGKKCWDDFQN